MRPKPAVPRLVVLLSIVVVLAVGVVVLVVVADEVAQGETVVCGDEVDAVLRLAPTLLVQRRTPTQALGKQPSVPVEAPDEVTRVVAEAPVPLGPLAVMRERPHLIQPPRVPGLGNELHRTQYRVVGDHGDHGRVGKRLADDHAPGVGLAVHVLGVPLRRRACHDGRQIEPEAVYMVLRDPVPEGVDDHLAHHWMVAVEGIATSAVIVELAVVGHHVVGAVVEAAKGQRKPLLVPLCSVVENHVHDNLDAVAVALANHGLELAPRSTPAVLTRSLGIQLLGREIADSTVTPEVVPHLAGHRVWAVIFQLVELMARHQLQRVEPHALEIR
mmetsp:Transcript_26266/g.42107  ORF Transcript_26266/g.42107 Transcript_26266/m.42107 type:complete len:329 (+) Transcript_26266:759-1745(+)